MKKLNEEQAEELRKLIDKLYDDTGINVIFSMCGKIENGIMCGNLYDVRNGGNIRGISHGYCPECMEEYRQKRKLVK